MVRYNCEQCGKEQESFYQNSIGCGKKIKIVCDECFDKATKKKVNK